jgi:hypothetical protein
MCEHLGSFYQVNRPTSRELDRLLLLSICFSILEPPYVHCAAVMTLASIDPHLDERRRYIGLTFLRRHPQSTSAAPPRSVYPIQTTHITMARKAIAKDQIVKLIVGAGQASPSPPVGPALGSKGVKSMDFCKVSPLLPHDQTTLRIAACRYPTNPGGQHPEP